MRYCDLHCDLLRKLTDIGAWSSTAEKENYQITLNGLVEGVFLQTFAVFAPNTEANMSYFEEKSRLFAELKKHLSAFGIKAALSVENGALLEGNAENLSALARAGVKIFAPVWNGGNDLGASHGNAKGLTPLGKTVAEQLAEYNILPDVSHLSENGFYQISDIFKRRGKPFIASHSNVRALCGHTRNLSDGQIRAVGESGGVIGINFYPPFLGASSPARHIAYIINKGGEDVAAIGSDFDGIDRGYYADCEEAYVRLETDLKKAGLTSRQTEKILCLNALRVLE